MVGLVRTGKHRVAAQDGEVELRIVHTNDTHSCVMPVNPNSSDTALADKGGFVRRAALVRDLRAEDPDLLLFDSGDFSQGSAYYNLYKGDVEVKLMNEMRYDAATIGNHEFDFGLDNMARIFREATFPIVCANYHFEGTVLEGLVRPYVILERKGVKVGVFGLGTQLEGMVASENYKGVTYEDPVTAANRVADELKTRSIATLWYAFPIWGGISTVWTTRNWCRPRAISTLCWAAIRILISSIPKC